MFPKPSKGSLTRERRRKRARIVEAQRAEKEKVRRRDGGICRWPTCRARTWLEVAHLEHWAQGAVYDGFSLASVTEGAAH